jgi:hypothetical protein
MDLVFLGLLGEGSRDTLRLVDPAERLIKLRRLRELRGLVAQHHDQARPQVDESEYVAWLLSLYPTVFSRGFGAHHHEFWRWVWTIERGLKPRPFVAIWPRGGAKSSSAEGATVALGARHRRRYALYCCATQDQADDHVASIAAMLEAPATAEHYPGMADRQVGKYGQSRGWRRNRLRTASGFVVDAVGLDSAARGLKVGELRPDLLVIDDVDNDTDTKAAAERKERLLTRKVLPTGGPDLAVLCVQNLVHDHSIFASLAKPSGAGGADWLVDRIISGPVPAVNGLSYEQRDDRFVITEGTPSWEGQSLAVCQAQVAEWGITAFLAEAQHLVSARAGGMYSHLSYRHCRPEDVPDLVRVAVWVDPAVTNTDTSDSQAIQADGIDGNGTIYRLRSYEQRSSPRAALVKAITWAHELGAEQVGVETDQGGDTWLDTYSEACRSIREQMWATDPSWDGKLPTFRYDKAGAGHGPKTHRSAQMLADYERPGRIVHVLGYHDILERALHRFPLTKPLDLCLAGGTMVSTERGPVAIEQVVAGDQVRTRDGFRRVQRSGMTSPCVELWELVTDDGHRLVGTEGHPVLTEHGWKALGACLDDKIWTWEPRRSPTRESATGGTLRPSNAATGRITPASPVASRSIVRSTSTLTAPSPPAPTSTTWTTIRSTTIPRTWKPSLLRSIGRSMARPGPTPTPWLSTWLRSRCPLLSGIVPPSGGSGTLNTPSGRGKGRTLVPSSVLSVGTPSSPDTRAGSNSARPAAGMRSRLGSPRTTRRESVPDVALTSTLGDGTSSGFVESRVVTVRTCGSAGPVYNLTVEGSPEFVADGVLVHNCDAAYWSWHDLRTRRFVPFVVNPSSLSAVAPTRIG